MDKPADQSSEINDRWAAPYKVVLDAAVAEMRQESLQMRFWNLKTFLLHMKRHRIVLIYKAWSKWQRLDLEADILWERVSLIIGQLPHKLARQQMRAFWNKWFKFYRDSVLTLQAVSIIAVKREAAEGLSKVHLYRTFGNNRNRITRNLQFAFVRLNLNRLVTLSYDRRAAIENERTRSILTAFHRGAKIRCKAILRKSWIHWRIVDQRVVLAKRALYVSRVSSMRRLKWIIARRMRKDYKNLREAWILLQSPIIFESTLLVHRKLSTAAAMRCMRWTLTRRLREVEHITDMQLRVAWKQWGNYAASTHSAIVRQNNARTKSVQLMRWLLARRLREVEHTIRLQRRNTWIKWKNMCAVHMMISDHTRLIRAGAIRRMRGIISLRLREVEHITDMQLRAAWRKWGNSVLCSTFMANLLVDAQQAVVRRMRWVIAHRLREVQHFRAANIRAAWRIWKSFYQMEIRSGCVQEERWRWAIRSLVQYHRQLIRSAWQRWYLQNTQILTNKRVQNAACRAGIARFEFLLLAKLRRALTMWRSITVGLGLHKCWKLLSIIMIRGLQRESPLLVAWLVWSRRVSQEREQELVDVAINNQQAYDLEINHLDKTILPLKQQVEKMKKYLFVQTFLSKRRERMVKAFLRFSLSPTLHDTRRFQTRTRFSTHRASPSRQNNAFSIMAEALGR